MHYTYSHTIGSIIGIAVLRYAKIVLHFFINHYPSLNLSDFYRLCFHNSNEIFDRNEGILC